MAFYNHLSGTVLFLSIQPEPFLISLLCLFSDEGKVQEAIRASQLCLRLLDTSVRDELRRLLTFMATAAHPDTCSLQKQVDSLSRQTTVIAATHVFDNKKYNLFKIVDIEFTI